MHLVSASSSRVSVTQPESRPNWGSQLGKSVVLAASSVGLGWLIGRLWTGTDEQPIGQAGSSGQLVIYREKQKDDHWSNAGSFSIESSEVFEHGLQPESSFHKVDIVYKGSIQETIRSSALSAENSNFHVLSACSLVGGLLMGGNIQLPLMVPLLALSMSKGVEALNYVDDNPVGTVIAYASKKLPEGYLRCNGARYSKDKYPELYDAIGGEYGEDDGSFRVPDFEGLFLRGTNDVSEIGKKSEDTTRLPRSNPFKAKDSGVHAHTTHSSGLHDHKSDLAGKHDHTSDLAGEHAHIIDKAGDHTHAVSSEGEHHHTVHQSNGHRHRIHDDGFHGHDIHNAGAHIHGLDKVGEHNHGVPGGFDQLLELRADGKYTARGGTDTTVGEPNIIKSGPILPNGAHTHVMHTDGVHSHTVSNAGRHNHNIDEGGVHTHGMSNEGKHAHTLNAVDSHTHKISSAVSHSHKISSAGEHVHKIAESGVHVHEIAESGNHVHEIVGGDAETSPKNMKVAYLIKAKRSENGSPAVIPDNGFISSQSIVMSLATAAFGFFVARMRR